jgi:hypothetical protein
MQEAVSEMLSGWQAASNANAAMIAQMPAIAGNFLTFFPLL